MSATTTAPPATYKLELRTALGPVYRDVLKTPPRDCTDEEIPVIGISKLFSDSFEDRKALSKEIHDAAVNNGFFYIKNHGISQDTIEKARAKALELVHPDSPKRSDVADPL